MVLVVVLAGTAVLSNAPAHGRGAPGGVVFHTMRDGNAEIYTMDGDGSNQTRVTEHSATDVDPAMSPNGRDIVFTSNRSGNNDVFVVDSRTGTAVNLTNHPGNDGWARWSPDGHRIAFHSNRDGNFEIYVVDADGVAPVRLTTYAGIDQFPDWSPDGRRIVFRRDVDIHVLDLMTGEILRLTNAQPLNQMASWSPNGRELVFMSARDGYPSVFRMDADGGNQINLTPKHPGDSDSDWVSRAPAWSTNGREIYFMSSRPATGGDMEVFAMNGDGSGVRRLTWTIGVDGSPRAR
jgi:Tol biopolymer transport system component